VCVISSFADFGEWYTAMPDLSRLIAQKVETKRTKRRNQISGSVKQQRDALRMFRMHGKVERPLLFNPGDAKRQRAAFCLRPRRAASAPGSGCLFRRHESSASASTLGLNP